MCDQKNEQKKRRDVKHTRVTTSLFFARPSPQNAQRRLLLTYLIILYLQKEITEMAKIAVTCGKLPDL